MKLATLIMIFALAAPVLASAEEPASLDQMRQAAEQGKAEAQLEMGILYEFGYNFPKHNVSAMAWYLRAAEQGLVKAAERRDQLKSRLTAEEFAEAQKLAAEPAAPASVNPGSQAPAPAPEAAAPASATVPAEAESKKPATN